MRNANHHSVTHVYRTFGHRWSPNVGGLAMDSAKIRHVTAVELASTCTEYRMLLEANAWDFN
jgi:hypothetical protein